MSRTISQRELRNDSGRVLREVQAGQTMIVTRRGVPVAELRPVPPRRFVPRAVIADAVLRAPRVDLERLWADLVIASTAAANGLPLYPRDSTDFAGLEEVVTVIAI